MIESATLRQKHEMFLATTLRTLWEQAHGPMAGNVRVLVGPDSVAAWIENAFSPAEWAAIRRPEGQTLVQRYADQLLTTILPDLRTQVETVADRRIVSGSIRADVDTGHVLCFFVLGERREVSRPDAGSQP